MTPVIGHFFGGPWDGETRQLEYAPLRLVVAQLESISLTTVAMDANVAFNDDELYTMRGSVLEGHAYYDHTGGI